MSEPLEYMQRVRELEAELAQAHRDLMAAVLREHERGVPLSRIGRDLGVSRATINNWVRAYREHE